MGPSRLTWAGGGRAVDLPCGMEGCPAAPQPPASPQPSNFSGDSLRRQPLTTLGGIFRDPVLDRSVFWKIELSFFVQKWPFFWSPDRSVLLRPFWWQKCHFPKRKTNELLWTKGFFCCQRYQRQVFFMSLPAVYPKYMAKRCRFSLCLEM